jgi:hypothetical protein
MDKTTEIEVVRGERRLTTHECMAPLLLEMWGAELSPSKIFNRPTKH